MKHKFSLIWRVAVALVLVLSFSLVVAVPVSAASLTAVSATPASSAPGVSTTYTIGFTTATTCDVKSVEMVFATGVNVSGATLGTVSGIGTGTLEPITTQTVTYTVNTPAVISAGTAITIKLSGIVNPATAGTYSVLVKTKDTGGAIIDSGTASVIIANPVTNANTGVTYATIGAAITAASAGQTINVAPGTYAEKVTISTAGVTLQATGTAAKTIIDVSTLNLVKGDEAVILSADNVTLKGFTIMGIPDTDSVFLVYLLSVKGCVVTDNIIRGPNGALTSKSTMGVDVDIPSGANTVTNNTISAVRFGIYLRGTDPGSTDAHIVSGNMISTVVIGIDAERSDGNTIASNRVTTATGQGIILANAKNNIVELNTFTNGLGIGVGVSLAGARAAGNVFRYNTINSNAGGGVVFEACAIGLNNVVNYNNIYYNANTVGGTHYDIENKTNTGVDATNNWWGLATGPIASQVSGPVTYSPWLTAPYTAVPPPVTTIDLVAGWNLVSLMLIPTSSTITDVLTDISTSVTIVQYYSAEAQAWLYYYPGVAESTLSTMEDGLGYWINMSAAATLDVSGTEMPEAPELPHTYSVFEGWNLVGFKSTTPMSCTLYLGNLENAYKAYSVLYGYDAVEGYFSVYPILEHSGNMEPGCGYWLWATADGTIVPPR